jgi:hypothetical protein
MKQKVVGLSKFKKNIRKTAAIALTQSPNKPVMYFKQIERYLKYVKSDNMK